MKTLDIRVTLQDNDNIEHFLEWVRTHTKNDVQLIPIPTSSLESLIERVEAQTETDPESDYDEGYNVGIKDAAFILRTTPCITAKALRKKGTDKWYWYNGTDNEIEFSTKDYPDNMDDESLEILKKWTDLPSDAELVTIQILIP